MNNKAAPRTSSKRRWTKSSRSDLSGLLLSNEAACLPEEGAIVFQSCFCDASDCKAILEEIGQRQFVYRGFDRRIGTQRYALKDNSTCPKPLQKLAGRIQGDSETKRLPATHVIVEEYSTTPWSYSGDYAPNHIVARFETHSDMISEGSNHWVARVPLNPVVHHINKPNERKESMWKLATTEHHTNIFLGPGALLLQMGEFLSGWRSYTTTAGVGEKTTDADNTSSIVLKFSSLPEAKLDTTTNQESDFGFIATNDDKLPRVGEMPPLRDLLTIVVTTSPIKSHPSTELLQRTFETFRLAGEEFCDCEKLIVCDGFRHQRDTGEVSRKHSTPKQAMRNGIVTTEQLANYVAFKEKLRELCAESPTDSPFRNTRVEELSERMGYGFALRYALRFCVKSPFVCVIQHDRTFMRPTPIRDVVHAMWRCRLIKYVGISMRSNLIYRDIFYSKYGKALQQEYESLVVRPPELLLDAHKYGPTGDFHESLAKVVQSVKVMENIHTYAKAYQSSSQCCEQIQWTTANPPPPGKHQLTLSPTLFWYDNTHVCETSHYRDFVFDPRYKMVAKGGFVEDKLSPVMKRTIERLGLTEGHSRFGCFLLDDHSGYFFTGHLDGGAYVATDKRATLATQR